MRRLFAVTLLLVAACSRSPSSPSEAPATPPPSAITFADFSGLWTVQYRVTTCLIDHGCVALKGSQQTFDVRLQQSGAEVRGLFVDRISVGEVSGRVSSDGTLVMTGFAAPAGSRDSAFTIDGLTIRHDGTLGLQGTLSYERIPPAYYEDATTGIKITGDIVSATRSDLSIVASVGGAYEGFFIVRGCTPVFLGCYPYLPDEVMSLRLTLSESGDTLTGMFEAGAARIPLQGRRDGGTLVFTGETLRPVSGGDVRDRILDWKSSVDAFGRMPGTFHLEDLWPAPSPRLGESAVCELVRLVKVVR